MLEILPNKAFEQMPRKRGVLSIRDRRSSTPGRSTQREGLATPGAG
jgi:hypothetical protein